MADREGPVVAPGPVQVEVDYDYEYKAKDKTVKIRQGESYLLVRKTNEDWWQVRREEGARAFYVPAQYVREVRRALLPPQKPPPRAKPAGLDVRRASDDDNLNRPPQPEMSSFGRPSPSSTPSPSSDRVTPPALAKDANHNLGSPHHCKMVAELVLLHNNNNHHLHHHHHHHLLHLGNASSSTLPRTRADSPPPPLRAPAGGGHLRASNGDRIPLSDEGSGDKTRVDSESGDELSSSSTELMQVSSIFTQGPRHRGRLGPHTGPPSGELCLALGDGNILEPKI
ncbi:rho GTPase-activating protein 12-like, partial [Gadus chalcogrammus]|uniref:rho GTPase-activating protein 12-like n=1 Tax=Gadus chalcogrammus TaxID=1042646 RepID=UPI0024C2A705